MGDIKKGCYFSFNMEIICVDHGAMMQFLGLVSFDDLKLGIFCSYRPSCKNALSNTENQTIVHNTLYTFSDFLPGVYFREHWPPYYPECL